MDRLETFIGNLVAYIIQPLIGLIFALALVFFVWGMAQFVLNAQSDKGREAGKQAILYGIIGLFIMTAVFGILSVVLNTFGVSLPN